MKKTSIITLTLTLILAISLSACGQNSKKEVKMKTGDGGIYKSRDGGENFFPINKISETKNLSNESIMDIAFSPQDSQVVYSGTKKSGIFRSADVGQTWAENKTGFSYVRRIELDPINDNILYIIAEKDGQMALFKTIDRGINWTQLLLQRDKQQPIVLDVLVDQKNPKIIYATDSTSGIYKSTDAGETWRSVYWGDFPTVGIVMDSQDDNLLYFVTGSQTIYITKDGGETFKVAQTGGPIYSMDVNKKEKGVSYVLFSGGLYVGKNGGETFELLPTLLKPNETVANKIVTDPIDANVLYLIAGQVLYKSIDAGKNWHPIPLKIKWAVTQFEINPEDNKQIYMGVTQPVKAKGNIPFFKF